MTDDQNPPVDEAPDLGSDAAPEETPAEDLNLEDMTDQHDEATTAEAENTSEYEDKLATDLESVFDVPVNVSAVLGKTNIEVSDLLKLSRGAIVELDRKVGEAIDIYVNNRLVARGEVVVVEDRLGVTMTEIVKNDQM